MRLINASRIVPAVKEEFEQYGLNLPLVYEAIQSAVDSIPTATRESDTPIVSTLTVGRWNRAKCLSCGWQDSLLSAEQAKVRYKYCPHCGAKMIDYWGKQ